MRKPTKHTRSARKQQLKTQAHQASVKGTVPKPRRTVFVYSTTAGGRYANN